MDTAYKVLGHTAHALAQLSPFYEKDRTTVKHFYFTFINFILGMILRGGEHSIKIANEVPKQVARAMTNEILEVANYLFSIVATGNLETVTIEHGRLYTVFCKDPNSSGCKKLALPLTKFSNTIVGYVEKYGGWAVLLFLGQLVVFLFAIISFTFVMCRFCTALKPVPRLLIQCMRHTVESIEETRNRLIGEEPRQITFNAMPRQRTDNDENDIASHFQDDVPSI